MKSITSTSNGCCKLGLVEVCFSMPLSHRLSYLLNQVKGFSSSLCFLFLPSLIFLLFNFCWLPSIQSFLLHNLQILIRCDVICCNQLLVFIPHVFLASKWGNFNKLKHNASKVRLITLGFSIQDSCIGPSKFIITSLL